MKTSDILTETTEEIVGISLDFNDLSSIQIGALRAISDGRLDFANATDRMMSIVYELQGVNLVDDAYDLTPMGEKAVGLALTLGGVERRVAAFKAQKQQEYDRDVNDYNDYENTMDDDDWSEYEMNRFGGLNHLGMSGS